MKDPKVGQGEFDKVGHEVHQGKELTAEKLGNIQMILGPEAGHKVGQGNPGKERKGQGQKQN